MPAELVLHGHHYTFDGDFFIKKAISPYPPKAEELHFSEDLTTRWAIFFHQKETNFCAIRNDWYKSRCSGSWESNDSHFPRASLWT